MWISLANKSGPSRRIQAEETLFAQFHVPLHIVNGTIGTTTKLAQQTLSALPALVIVEQIFVAELSATFAHDGRRKFSRFLLTQEVTLFHLSTHQIRIHNWYVAGNEAAAATAAIASAVTRPNSIKSTHLWWTHQIGRNRTNRYGRSLMPCCGPLRYCRRFRRLIHSGRCWWLRSKKGYNFAWSQRKWKSATHR